MCFHRPFRTYFLDDESPARCAGLISCVASRLHRHYKPLVKRRRKICRTRFSASFVLGNSCSYKEREEIRPGSLLSFARGARFDGSRGIHSTGRYSKTYVAERRLKWRLTGNSPVTTRRWPFSDVFHGLKAMATIIGSLRDRHFAQSFHHTSTGPFGTGICSRIVEVGSRMNDATIGGGRKRGCSSPFASRNC